MFVNEGKPTGITQYNQLIYSSRIASRGAAIAEILCRYYDQEVLPRLQSTPFYEAVKGRFTCDLALHPDALDLLDESVPKLTKEHVKLVELNCFYEATGMGLFDYHADKQRLDNGPFEWRVRTKPLPQAAVKLEQEWREVLLSIRKGTAPTSSSRNLTDQALQQLLAAQSLPHTTS